MDKVGGKVAFIDKSDVTTDELIPANYIAEQVIISRDNFGCGETADEAIVSLKNQGICAIVLSNIADEFDVAAKKGNMIIVNLDKKSIEDMFHTFGDKDTEASIIYNDDNTAKVKLISGSLSKSYLFHTK